MSFDSPGLPSWPRTTDRESDDQSGDDLGGPTSSPSGPADAERAAPRHEPGENAWPPRAEKSEPPATSPATPAVPESTPPAVSEPAPEPESIPEPEPAPEPESIPEPEPASPPVSEPVPEAAPVATADTAIDGQQRPVAGPAAPVLRRTRSAPPPRRRRKARRVHRVMHHFDIWSVAKVAAAFAICGYFVTLITGMLVWQMARRVGTLEGIEGFMEDTGGYNTFNLHGHVVFQVAAFAGVLLAVLAVCLAVLGAVLFNLISDLTGGIRMTVIDEDLIVTPARRPPSTDDTSEAQRPRPD